MFKFQLLRDTLSLGFLAIACQTSEIRKLGAKPEVRITSIDQCQPSPTEITRSQALEDVERMLFLFENAYSGFWDWRAAGGSIQESSLRFSNSLKTFEDPVPVEDLASLLSNELTKNTRHRDRHLTFYHFPSQNDAKVYGQGPLKIWTSQKIFSKNEFNSLKALECFKELEWGHFEEKSKQVLRLVSFSEAMPTVRCKNLSGFSNIQYLDKWKPWLSPAYSGDSKLYQIERLKKLTILRLNSFYSPRQTELENMVLEASRIDPQRPVLIDLRKNSGGSYYWILELMRAWGYAELDLIQTNVWLSPASLQGRENFLACEDLQGQLDDKLKMVRRQYAQQARKDWESNRRHSDTFWLPKQESIEKDRAKDVFQFQAKAREKALNAKVAILTSRRCGSSCEAAIAFLRQMPNVKIFGEPTGGVLKYGDSVPYVLPHSRLRVYLATTRLESQGKAIFGEERIGILPDLWVSPETAEASAKQWLLQP